MYDTMTFLCILCSQGLTKTGAGGVAFPVAPIFPIWVSDWEVQGSA